MNLPDIPAHERTEALRHANQVLLLTLTRLLKAKGIVTDLELSAIIETAPTEASRAVLTTMLDSMITPR